MPHPPPAAPEAPYAARDFLAAWARGDNDGAGKVTNDEAGAGDALDRIPHEDTRLVGEAHSTSVAGRDRSVQSRRCPRTRGQEVDLVLRLLTTTRATTSAFAPTRTTDHLTAAGDRPSAHLQVGHYEDADLVLRLEVCVRLSAAPASRWSVMGSARR